MNYKPCYLLFWVSKPVNPIISHFSTSLPNSYAHYSMTCVNRVS